jgi:hypothetical protein
MLEEEEEEEEEEEATRVFLRWSFTVGSKKNAI